MRRARNRYILAIDAALLSIAPLGLYSLRLESLWLGSAHWRTVLIFILVTVPLQIVTFFVFGLYRRLWRYASVGEIQHIFSAATCAAIPAYVIGRYGLFALGLTPLRMPLSVLVPNALLCIGLVAAPRLLIRIAGWRSQRRQDSRVGRRVIIVGAGVAGEMIVKELNTNHELQMRPVGFVDDDVSKHNLKLANIPVLGSLSDIRRIVRDNDVEELIIAMPRAPGSVIRPVVRAAQESGIRARIVPGLFEILSDRVGVTAIREVEIEDLLRRDPIQTDLAAVGSIAGDRSVLVTGAGGSIGSELCRQVHALRPRQLILVGHGENTIFDILNELRLSASSSEIIPVIADIRDRKRLRAVIERYRPETVFHAAAHKHVPLMEENAAEAVTNNVLGTKNVVDACVEFDVERLVLISTDKAVRPTNVMGATKRVAEQLVHAAAKRHGCRYVAVRFGNVLGSRGSVVPTFVRQIKAGGPVTVTHPEVRRYFMTIPEAVQLVLQAGALAKGAELFMFDMGNPVRVVDLARDMIRLSGFEVDSDIEIQFTGLRPGEKLYEEMFFSYEVAEPTSHPKILRARNEMEACEPGAIDDLIEAAVRNMNDAEIRRRLTMLVPDYCPGGDVPVRIPVIVDQPNSARPRVRTEARGSSDILISLPSV